MTDFPDLDRELQRLILHGRGVLQLEGQTDAWVSGQFPHLATLVQPQAAGELLADLTIDLISAAVESVEPVKRSEIVAAYVGMPGIPPEVHKNRQTRARVELGELNRGEAWSQSKFRQYTAPELRQELIKLMLGPAPGAQRQSATAREGAPRRTHIDWPLIEEEHRPRRGQDIVVLAATPTMRHGPQSALTQLVREIEPYFVNKQPMIYALDGSWGAILRAGLLHDYGSLIRLPAGVEGGLVYATELVLAARAAGNRCTVVYLTDPRDPSSRYPAAQALKRACVIEHTPFLTSTSGALRWLRLEWAESVLDSDETAPDALALHLLLTPKEASVVLEPPADECIALAAHDSHKQELLDFASDHQSFLTAMFPRRYATEVTGRLLNGDHVDDELRQLFGRYSSSEPERNEVIRNAERWQDEQKRLPGPAGKPNWVKLLAHGRVGGLTQLARRVIAGECSTAVFFQDAATPLEHDMDVQVLDRASQLTGADCLLLYDKESAERWATALGRCQDPNSASSALTLVQAYKEVFDVDLVLAYPRWAKRKGGPRKPDAGVWERVVACAATYILEAVVSAVRTPDRPHPVRVGLSWGGAIHDVVSALGDDQGISALGVREHVKRQSRDRARKKFSRPEGRHDSESAFEIAARGVITAEDLRVLPMVGVMGSQNRAIESHALVSSMTEAIGGEAVTFNEYAFERRNGDTKENGRNGNGRGDRIAPIESEWRQLDLAICSCDKVRDDLRRDVVGFPADLHKVLKRADAEFGHLYLSSKNDDFKLADYGPYRSTGVPFAELQNLASRSSDAEVILVAGAQEERVKPAWTALRSNLVSTFITDPNFAWDVLRKEFPRQLK